MGRGTEGMGFSVSLAKEPPMFADDHGVADGLSISFLTYSGRLVVEHAGSQLADLREDAKHPTACNRYNCQNCIGRAQCLRADCPFHEARALCSASTRYSRHSFRTPDFVRVSITLADERLSVVHDGHAYVLQLLIPGWDATAREGNWQLVMGARTDLHLDDHWVRSWQVQQGALISQSVVPLVLNGTTLGASSPCGGHGQDFRFYAEPVISHLSLAQGPVRGGALIRVLRLSQQTSIVWNKSPPTSRHARAIVVRFHTL